MDGRGVETTRSDIPELADKICSLIENEEMSQQMGEMALKNSERFLMKNIALQWKELFESLTKKA